MKRDWLWLTARIFSGIITVYWLAVSLAYVLFETRFFGFESLLMILLIVLATAGVFIAWWRVGTGTILLLVAAILNSVFAVVSFGHHPLLAVAVFGGPYFVMVLLFGVIWLRDNRTGRAG